ncbi:hypothetical protein [Pelagibius sp. Alg239-R121]|uniref:hypothetical protein n=1 Tax=Pelagibius sp. Alg239-R121 TaxID=2993448 RepID=UPI0024A62EFD|nr:hypothetical protein [Pelagibius sp. Alg239-R121]
MAEVATVMPLHEVPAFRGLKEVAKEFGVEFTLFGGAATRALMYMHYRPGEDFDLFNLTPFTSDIDLWHNGEREDTPNIMQAINETILFAPWCRWALQDADIGKKAAVNRSRSTRVPLRSLALSTLESMEIPTAAIEDLQARRVSFERNEAYRQSDFARKGRDAEIFGLIMALNLLADMRDIAGEGELTEEEEALRWVTAPDAWQELYAPVDTGRLTTRLWHLLASYMARSNPGSSRAADVLIEFAGQSEGLRSAKVDLQGVFFDGQPLSASKMTAAGGFRVPELSPEVVTGVEAQTAFEKICTELQEAGLPAHDLPQIDPAFELIGVVPEITVRGEAGTRYEDGGNPDSVFESWSPADFVHLAWQDDGGAKSDLNPGHLNPAGMTACVLPRVADQSYGWANAAAVGGRFAGGRNWIRVDLQDTTDRGRDAKDKPASILILQSRL